MEIEPKHVKKFKKQFVSIWILTSHWPLLISSLEPGKTSPQAINKTLLSSHVATKGGKTVHLETVHGTWNSCPTSMQFWIEHSQTNKGTYKIPR